ncbi:MAG: anthranilate phosphoribosyltransferase [Acidimicrobiales bacterium]|nr:anthranilate phosphoribosyltransferase [Acidimicrobiales bacterium]
MALDDVGGWSGVLGALAAGEDLSSGTARRVMEEMLAGLATPAQMAAVIVALRVKGESVEEITGMVEAMLDAAEPCELGADAVDIVGVGGSPARRVAALNVSTMASFVVAGAGVPVCKHGNRRASSTSGSFDLLEALGVVVELPTSAVPTCVQQVGLGFCFARAFHPAMRHVAPVRAELGIPTVFNVLGPLANPGRVTRQVIGVADHSLGERMIEVLAARGSARSMIVTGAGNLDELTTTGTSQVLELRDGQIRRHTVDPGALGLQVVDADALHGGDATANAAIAHRVFAGEDLPARHIVALNAAAGLLVGGAVDDLAGGLEQAYASLDQGRAAAKVAELAELTTKLAASA